MMRADDVVTVLSGMMIESGQSRSRSVALGEAIRLILEGCPPAQPAPNDVNDSLRALVRSLDSQTAAISALVQAMQEDPQRDEAQDTIPGMEVEYLNPPRNRG